MKSKITAFPYLLWMIIFIVVTLGMVVYFAVTDDAGHFTMANISRVGDYASVIFRSLWLAAIATVICLVASYPFAYILSRKTEHQQRMMVMLVMLPMWMNFLPMPENSSLKRIKHPSGCCSDGLRLVLTGRPESWISFPMQGWWDRRREPSPEKFSCPWNSLKTI